MATRATVNKLVGQRRRLDVEIGKALADISAKPAPKSSAIGQSIHVPSGAKVAVRIAKAGLAYSFALNLHALPFDPNNFYFLILPVGVNGLVWTLAATKPVWAFQVDLIVNGQVRVLSQGISSPGTKPPSLQQQVLIVP